MIRDVNPFDYWENHSSAIDGLGGFNRSPDPRYLFHTQYHEVRAGRAQYILKLGGVRASFGELSVRVHAWKPEGETNVSLVSGGRLLLQGHEDAELVLPVHFVSQKGVRYALYGYLAEDSDISAKALQVIIDEPDDFEELLPEPPLSVLAINRKKEETRPANSLLHYGRTDIDHPVSQSCTIDELIALKLLTAKSFTRQDVESQDAAIVQWSEALSLNALNTYGVTHAGLEGLVVGPASDGFLGHLSHKAALTRLPAARPPSRMSDVFFDFLLMPSEPAALGEISEGLRGRWNTTEDWLERLKIGGLAVLSLRYRPDNDLVSSDATSDTQMLSRNEIGQWTLRLIGKGYSVAPLAFAPLSKLVVDSQGLAGFILIVQRL